MTMTASTTERFNKKLADTGLAFIHRHLVHTEGESLGQPVTPMKWQRDIFRKVIGTQVFAPEFGEWVRRYTKVYIEIPRKNGKSFFLSAVAIYHLMYDPSLRGHDIVCVACDSEQATIVFDTAAAMIEENDELSRRCYIARRSNKRIENVKNNNRLFVIPGDAEGALGLRPAVIMFDELLAQKKRALYDFLTTGQGSAHQPLLYMITTAGEYGTICHDRHEYGRRVLAGEIDDPNFLFVRYGMDDGDDWTDPKVWKKANPGLGTSPTMRFLASEFREAQQSFGKQLTFRKFYLNEWNLSETSWLDMGAWDECGRRAITPDDVAGLPCWIGVDLSSRSDLTAVVAIFRGEDERIGVACRFFLPEDGIDEKSRRDGVPYRGWAAAGHITLTPGRTVDYGAVFEGVRELAEMGDLQSVGYDAHNAGDFEVQLGKVGLPAFDVPQGFWLSEPLKALETAMIDGRLEHGGNPVLRWNAQNAIVKISEEARIKIVKRIVTKRIDGIAALANAFDRMMRVAEDEPVAEPSIRYL
jgi:phage terminase large subunit-like protein